MEQKCLMKVICLIILIANIRNASLIVEKSLCQIKKNKIISDIVKITCFNAKYAMKLSYLKISKCMIVRLN